jgi:hypothetical protein
MQLIKMRETRENTVPIQDYHIIVQTTAIAFYAIYPKERQ